MRAAALAGWARAERRRHVTQPKSDVTLLTPAHNWEKMRHRGTNTDNRQVTPSAETDSSFAGVRDLEDAPLGTLVASYEQDDAILYALAVGAQADELELVYERDQKVLSTYAMVLGLWTVEAAGRTGAYDPVDTLHVSQTLTMHRDLEPAGDLEMSGSIRAVWDKGAAALVEIGVTSEYFDAVYGIWIPGAGGYGGDRGPSAKVPPETDPPELEVDVPSTPEQAALYRLTGDKHPLHIDPAVASGAGYERPILHGLCTVGSSVLSLARASGEDATRLSHLRARFASVTYPGDALRLGSWSDDENGDRRFLVTRGAEPVLTGGRIAFGVTG